MLHALNNLSTVKIDPWNGQKCPLVQKWTNLWVFHFLVIIVWMSNLSIIYFLHLSIQNQLHESLNSTRQFQIEDEIFLLLSPEDVFLGQVMLKVKLWACSKTLTHALYKVRVFAEILLYLNRIVTFLFLCFSDLAWIYRIDSRTLDFQFNFSVTD